MLLRGYQKKLLADAKAEIDAGHNRVLAVMATGAGKTATACSAVKARAGRGQRVVWSAHRRELITQAVKTLASYGIQAGHNGIMQSAPVQVISPQGALARGHVPPADFVVLDECRHYMADSFKRVVDSWPAADVLGLDATPERGDGRPLDGIFNAMVLGPQSRQLVDMGYLVPAETHEPPRVQPPGKLAQFPVDAYRELGLVGKRNVVFALDIRNAEAFAAGFRAKGIRAEVLTGETPTAKRDQMLRDFADGRFHVIVNCMVLTEGTDIPNLEVITLARPFGSASAYIQACGRGLRICDGKEFCTIIDLVGAKILHGDILDEREYSLDGEPIRRKGANGPSFCRVCGCLVEDCGCGAGSELAELYKATNDPLVKYARIRRDDDAARAARLSRWIHESIAKGHKWQSSLFRFDVAYGVKPTSDIISHAKALADGLTWCPECRTSRCAHALAANTNALRPKPKSTHSRKSASAR